ncbi:hypothetical protein SAMN04488057_10771 [Cyclobacterium lianum]|uniref:Uncharacterized protein n=1 Tax=Cyclobacterium lianum TaxID=388280 RepID=A0A1M7P6L3_9BACT|nr:hypothetical protein [Cyclobacterium lianum]SHN12282.1 hypothetical protein SAMN04488057_10771 [Cyclobacterium lianum]
MSPSTQPSTQIRLGGLCRNSRFLLAIAVLNFLPYFLGAQNLDTLDENIQLVLVQTKDGNEYLGRIISEDEVKITIRTDNLGEITLFRSDIVRISGMDTGRMVNGEFWFANPQATRYYWLPNGYGLKKGEAYYQNVWIFFNQVSTGITDNFSIGGGLVPLFLFAGAQTPVWITPKVSFPVVKDKINLGAGALAGTVIGLNEGNFGMLYGLSTFGSRDKNLTIGLGWAFAGGSIANAPTISVAGMVRTGPRGYFLTENYFIAAGGETVGLISAGGRRIIRRMSLDYGLFLPLAPGLDTIIAVPWLGLTLPFGKN